ncbi:MAG: hypothetical protein LBC86_11180 [Oscillospiraceae bacterium]|jgi:hypothetical protein|nr:hypothetical protein [Oscillospiraceae bacterium]
MKNYLNAKTPSAGLHKNSFNSRAGGIVSGNSPQIWNAALYLRLSKEDGDNQRAESESITGQKALLTEYVKSKPEIRVCSERVDDGFSGVNLSDLI